MAELVIRIPLDLEGAKDEGGLTDPQQILLAAHQMLTQPPNSAFQSPYATSLEEKLAEGLAHVGIWTDENNAFVVDAEDFEG